VLADDWDGGWIQVDGDAEVPHMPEAGSRPTWLPGRRWLNGPMRTSSSTVDASTTLAQIVQSRPIVESTIVAFGPTVVPVSTDVRPRRIDPGSIVTSSARTTSQSR